MSEDFILETKKLEKSFGGVRAIDGVNFRLARGELRCLIGPNGAGKSTFFKMVTAQLKPSGGRIIFDGNDVTRAEAHKIARLGVGIKNQVPDVFDGITVRENIWLAARFRKRKTVAKLLLEDVMDKLGLTDFRDQLVGGLSHGQRQWVELGMVLVSQPKLILLDEPTAGMTAQEVQRTAQFIRELNGSTSIIVVEHDMQFIRLIASKVTVFHHGRILVEDSMEGIQKNQMVRDIYLGKG
ncbi:MAG: ATP-binding cassette domain-containing protein [Pseudomonadota bacterium]